MTKIILSIFFIVSISIYIIGFSDEEIFEIDNFLQNSIPLSDSLENSTVLASNLKNETFKFTDNTSIDHDCQSYVVTELQTIEWKKNKYKAISKIFSELSSQQVSSIVQDKVAMESGVGLIQGRKFRNEFKGARKMPRFHDEDAELAKVEEISLVNKLIKAKDYSSLNDYIIEGKLKSNTFYPSISHTKFLLSYILELVDGEKVEVIDKLIDNSVPVTYSDLVYITELNIPKETLEKVYQSSDLKATKVFENFKRHLSLALIAIKNGNPDMFYFWASKGSPLQPDPFGPNALDYLVRFGSKFDQNTRDDLFQYIVSIKISPFFSKSSSRLKEIISPTVYKKHKSQLLRSTINLNKKQQETVNTNVLNIYKTVLTKIINVNIEELQEKRCFITLGNIKTKYVMTPLTSIKKPSIVKKKNEKNLKNEKNSLKINDSIDSSQSLDYKQTLLKNKLSIIKDNLDEYEKLNRDTSNNLMQKTVREVYELARKGMWDEAINLLNQLDVDDENVMTTLLMLAIDTDASMDIIDNFINKGGKLISPTIVRLISKNNLPLAQKLLPYGLNIHQIDPLGYSTLAQSVKYGDLEFLTFLINNGVPIDSHFEGVDALDIALQKFRGQRTQLLIISSLLSAGAIVEQSHKDLINEIKNNNFDIYMSLISTHPTLVD